MRFSTSLFVALGAVALLPNAAHAQPIPGGKLPLTRGVSNIEGVGGGGLSNWALITGQETDAGIGASAYATQVELSDYELTSYGVALGFYDRVEISLARQEFDTGGTGALLGLGEGYTFDQTIIGAKVRLLGNAVYDQDRWLPQVAVGVELKHNNRDAVIGALGGDDNDGVDYYISATKIVLEQSLVLSGTVRATRANQFGILGFGGDAENDYTAQFEGSAGYLVSDRLLVGGEYRTKPDNLSFAEENDAFDVFGAYAVTDAFSITAAYVDAGDIATFENQRGFYISLQAGF